MLENEGEYKHAKRRDGGTGEVDNTNRGREGGRERKREGEREGGRVEYGGKFTMWLDRLSQM